MEKFGKSYSIKIEDDLAISNKMKNKLERYIPQVPMKKVPESRHSENKPEILQIKNNDKPTQPKSRGESLAKKIFKKEPIKEDEQLNIKFNTKLIKHSKIVAPLKRIEELFLIDNNVKTNKEFISMAKKSVDLYNTMLRNIEIFERYN